MVLVLNDATIVTGDGTTVVERGAVVIEDARIVEVRATAVSGHSTDELVELNGALLVPGAINSHTHGSVLGPLFASGAPALPEAQVLANLDTHLRGGTTTVLNVDGFNLPEEAEPIAKQHPINIKIGTTHFPIMFDAARRADGSGVEARHEQMTLDEMLDQGSPAIAEIGAGHTLGGGGQDYRDRRADRYE
jgi:hypothetical protein